MTNCKKCLKKICICLKSKMKGHGLNQEMFNNLMRSAMTEENYDKRNKSNVSYDSYFKDFSKIQKDRSTTNTDKTKMKCPIDQLQSGRCVEMDDGSLSYRKIKGDLGFHAPEDEYKYRSGIGWTDKKDAEQAYEKSRDEYDEKTGRAGFRKVNQGITDFVDYAVEKLPINPVTKEIYEAFAPPTSKFYNKDD